MGEGLTTSILKPHILKHHIPEHSMIFHDSICVHSKYCDICAFVIFQNNCVHSMIFQIVLAAVVCICIYIYIYITLLMFSLLFQCSFANPATFMLRNLKICTQTILNHRTST